MDLRYYRILPGPEQGSVQIVGKMLRPVNWEFRIVFEPKDVAGLIKVAINRHMFSFVLRNSAKYINYVFNKKNFKFKDEDDIVKRVIDFADKIIPPSGEESE